jgi:hypothetical protein
MKTTILLFSLLGLVNVAQASEKICGVLTSVNIAPKCEPGERCPHNFHVERILTNTAGVQTILETSSQHVLSKMVALDKQTVCATGNYDQAGSFEVTSINAAKSAF